MRTVVHFVLTGLFVAAFSQVTFAQSAPEQGPSPGMQMTPEQFNLRKTHLLSMIEERRTRLGQEKACVEAAKDIVELRKCRPERPMMGPGGPHQGGPNQQRPPLSPMGQPQ
jgi:hypothetical protein